MRILLHFPGTDPAPLAGLATDLLARGHAVAFSRLAGCVATLPEGATTLWVHRRWPLRALLEEQRTADAERCAWLRVEIEACVARDIFDGDLLEVVRGFAPDLIVADSGLRSPVQFVAHQLRVPCLQLSLTFARRWSDAPPLTSHCGPEAGELQRAGARWEGSCLFRRLAGVPVPQQVAGAVERLAVATGYPADGVSLAAGLAPALTRFPEALVCESALDFEGGSTDYLAIAPVPAAGEQSVPHVLREFAATDRPLVFVAMEAEDLSAPLPEPVVHALRGAMQAPASWKFVVAAPGAPTASAFTDMGGDVLVIDRAPIEWLLVRCAAVVTAATLPMLRAAVSRHTPMLAIPVEADQPGNAARIVHHGLGLRLRPGLLSARVIQTALRDLFDDGASFRERLRIVDDACRAEQARHAGVDVVENLAMVADGVRRISPAVRRATAAGTAIEPGDDAACLDYALWCLRRTLAPIAARDPDRVDVVSGLVAQYAAARLARAPEQSLQGMRRAICERASAHWRKGFGVAVYCAHPEPRRAALLARLEAVAVLARAATGAAGSDTERSLRFADHYATLTHEFDAELRRRVGRGEAAAR